MGSTQSEASTRDREIVLSRVFDAPRELVFDAWTDPAHIDEWWGPDGFTTTTTQEMDVRPGGFWRFVMRGTDGKDWDNVVRYIEVARPERLVYMLGDSADPDQFEVTIRFEDRDGKTELTMRSVFPTAEARDYVVREVGAIEGGKQTLARLADYLAKMSR